MIVFFSLGAVALLEGLYRLTTPEINFPDVAVRLGVGIACAGAGVFIRKEIAREAGRRAQLKPRHLPNIQ